MSNIAHLDTASLDTAAKFFRIMQKAGADFTGPMQSTTKRANLAEYLKLGCPKVNQDGAAVIPTLPEGADLARMILGDDFIAPEDVAEAYGFTYSDEQLVTFADTLPDFETLMWLRINGFMLVAGPNADLNLLGVRALDQSLFYHKSDRDDWFEQEMHTFSRIDMVRGGQWLMLRKGDVPNSRSKNWDEQSSLVTSPEYVPNAAEFTYGVTVYGKVRGVYLLPNFWVRTSSVDGDEDRVRIGRPGRQSFYVFYDWDHVNASYLGVSSARN
jgi:hypothetical protein